MIFRYKKKTQWCKKKRRNGVKKKRRHTMTSLLRYQTESNRRTRFCRPLPSHSAMVPFESAKIQLFFIVQTLFEFF